MRCAIPKRCNPSSKKSSANIPTSGCGFTGAGKPARPGRRRRTKAHPRWAAREWGCSIVKLDPRSHDPARTLAVVRKCRCAGPDSGRPADLSPAAAVPGAGHLSAVPGGGVAEHLVLRAHHRTGGERSVRAGAAGFLFPWRGRVLGGRRAAWVVPGDRGHNHLGDGGVARAFNNMLTVIAGYAELLGHDVPAGGATRKFVDEIVYAGKRAASLTQRLLAFSRGGGAQPLVLDLNLTLSNMEPMLRRLLGQNIELLLLTAPGLGRIKADPSQIEQVIVNLAANARDAMPNGGKLVVETANVDVEEQSGERLGMKPGPCVLLAVSDNGIGMDPATRSRLFEPFFTTKVPGQGSGLGLSTVYGVIKQAEGQVTVFSQPNCGTIFEVYLPRAPEAVSERVPTRPP